MFLFFFITDLASWKLAYITSFQVPPSVHFISTPSSLNTSFTQGKLERVLDNSKNVHGIIIGV